MQADLTPDDDYALHEYGVTPAELERFEKAILAEVARKRTAGKLHEYTGDIETLFAATPLDAQDPTERTASRES